MNVHEVEDVINITSRKYRLNRNGVKEEPYLTTDLLDSKRDMELFIGRDDDLASIQKGLIN